MDIAQYIAQLRAEGLSFQRIAERLNAENIPSPRGNAKWWGESVFRVANPNHIPGSKKEQRLTRLTAAYARAHELKQQGFCPAAIASQLNYEGAPVPTFKVWSKTAVAFLLSDKQPE